MVHHVGSAHNMLQHHVDLHQLLCNGDHVKKDGMGEHVECRDKTDTTYSENLKEKDKFVGLCVAQIAITF